MRTENVLNEHLHRKGSPAPQSQAATDDLVLLAWHLSQLKSAPLPADVADNPDFLAFQADDGQPTWADLYDVEEYLLAQPETKVFRHLAARLGVSLEEMWRYIGPQGAVKLGRLLDRPAYDALFAFLGVTIHAFRRLTGVSIQR